MNARHTVSLLTFAALTFTAPAQQDAGMADMMKALGSMMSGGTNAAAVVDFRDLKALLPAELTGLTLAKPPTGERSGVMGMTIAFAVADFQSDDGQYVSVKISDMGGTGSLGAMMGGWTMMDIDRETDTGYERTTTIKGCKAMETYDSSDKRGEINVMVGQRFMVEVSGNGVSDQTLREAVEKIDFEKLTALKPKAAQ